MKARPLLFAALLSMCALPSLAQDLTAELLATAAAKTAARDYGSAEAIYERILHSDSTNVEVRFLLAEVLRRNHNPPGAINQAQEILAIDSSSARAWGFIGLVYIGTRQFGFAHEAYTVALDHTIDSDARYGYFSNRAVVHQQAGDWRSSIADIDSAIAIGGETNVLLINKARNQIEVGAYGLAKQTLQRVAADTADTKGRKLAISNLAYLHVRSGALDSAVVYFQVAAQYIDIDNDPIHAGLHYSNLADCQLRMGKIEEGLANTSLSVQCYPGNPYVYRTIGLLYLAIGLTKEACRAWTYASEIGFNTSFGPEVSSLRAEHCGL